MWSSWRESCRCNRCPDRCRSAKEVATAWRNSLQSFQYDWMDFSLRLITRSFGAYRVLRFGLCQFIGRPKEPGKRALVMRLPPTFNETLSVVVAVVEKRRNALFHISRRQRNSA